MQIFINIFNTVLYRPLFNILILLYQYLPGQDLGIAIIALTVLIRIIFYPLSSKAIKSQKSFQEIQPKFQEIQQKYKDDKEKQAKALMELYQRADISPLSGCLPLLIQLPILIALYQVLKKGLIAGEMTNLYSFVPIPTQINPIFLGLIDLNAPHTLLALLAAILQFIQAKMLSPTVRPTEKKDMMVYFSGIFQKQTLYIFPILTFFILLRLPSAIGLYWLVSTIFSVLQQYLINRKVITPAS